MVGGPETVKVAFVSHDAQLGGASRALVDLVEGLRPMGVECHVMVPGRGPLVGELRRLGAGVAWSLVPWWAGATAYPWDRVARSAAVLLAVGPLAATLVALRCDLVYTNTMTVPAGALAARLLGLPHIWHLHEYWHERSGLHLDLGFPLTARVIDRLSNACVTVSQAVAETFRPFVAPRKLRTVYQAVTVRPDGSAEEQALEERARAGREFRMVIAGPVVETKGQADAVFATSRLLAQGIDAELLVVGGVDRRYGEYLRRLAASLGLGERVRLLGWMDNPYPILRTADVVLMCSRAESFGRVTVEGMLAGKPVVGTRAAGTTELVREGFNGLLYTPGEPEELAQRLAFLHGHPELARLMGQNGHRWASEQFARERYARDIAAILQEAVAEHQAARRGVAQRQYTGQARP